MFHAIENDDLIMVKTLLEFGALTRVYNFGGVTPLDIIVNELSTVSNGVKNLVFQNLIISTISMITVRNIGHVKIGKSK